MTFVDAIEEFAAEHNESIDELLAWPAERFEVFYEAFGKRKVIQSLERRKLAMIGGMHGNSNLSGEDLAKAVHAIEESFDDAIASVYGSFDDDEVEAALKDNPFFSAMKLPEIETTTHTEPGFPYPIEVDES